MRPRPSWLIRQSCLALERGELEIHYEPIIRLSDGTLAGANALLRWRHPVQGLLEPAAFTPALNSSPIAARIGHWVLAKACSQLKEWRCRASPDMRVCVGILEAQFRTGDLTTRVFECLKKEGLPPSALDLEIPESILLRFDPHALNSLTELRSSGVAISVGNYGTGSGSLELLKHAPISRLKIDPLFVAGMLKSKSDAAIIRTILYLGKNLGFNVTAKGVTSAEQCERLLRKGCEEAQGLYLGAALPPHGFESQQGIFAVGAN